MKKLISVFAIVATLLTAAPVMADFYVIPTGTRYKHPEVVSAFVRLDGTPSATLTVPAGKTFILTDIVCIEDSVTVYFKENDIMKTAIRFYYNGSSWGLFSYHLNTGIPFATGTEVRGSANKTSVYVTITGYFIEN